MNAVVHLLTLGIKSFEHEQLAERIEKLGNRDQFDSFADPVAFYHSPAKWMPRLVTMAKIDHCTLHDLRRTCNTIMKDAGVSEEVALQVIGNISEVNRKHYTGALRQQQRMAVDALPSVG